MYLYQAGEVQERQLILPDDTSICAARSGPGMELGSGSF